MPEDISYTLAEQRVVALMQPVDAAINRTSMSADKKKVLSARAKTAIAGGVFDCDLTTVLTGFGNVSFRLDEYNKPDGIGVVNELMVAIMHALEGCKCELSVSMLAPVVKKK